ncbi:hypothetical protein M513_13187 [Trichuris suis]|uniref:ISXO2-like transposase domain-containing protein n=1 Tax=Trichuris suis TaxID=68888 RepID=A0A085LLV3_9BILA|nr:hypothetical protein M513_13187 [Trichuris suis]
MSLRLYFLNIRDEESAAAFLRERGIFHQHRSCPSCHRDMDLCGRGPTVCPQWRCRNSACRRRISARQGTWFAELNASTTVHWNRHLRSVAAEAVGELSHPIGGPSKTVELDETMFCRRKYNRGRSYGRQQWVFGGTCCETGESFVELVHDRTTATLLPIILRHVRPDGRVASVLMSCTT